MTKYSGKNLYVSFAGVNLSGTQRTCDTTHTQETADATAGADDYRNFVNTVKMIEANLEVVGQTHSTGGSAILAALALGAEGTLIISPEGTATGKPRLGFYARVADMSASYPFDDVVVYKPKFQMAGTALIYDGVTTLH